MNSPLPQVAVKYFEPTTAVVASSVAAAADPTSQNRSASSVSDFLHEAQLLLELRHPNVLLFIGVLTKPKLAIVTEYLPRVSDWLGLIGNFRSRGEVRARTGGGRET